MTDAPLTEAEISGIAERHHLVAAEGRPYVWYTAHDDRGRLLATIRERDALVAIYKGREEARSVIITALERRVAALTAALDDAKATLQETQEILDLSDGTGKRSTLIHGAFKQDADVKALCEMYGYGFVMDSAARQWFLIDPIGAHTRGAAALNIRNTQALISTTLAKIAAVREEK